MDLFAYIDGLLHLEREYGGNTAIPIGDPDAIDYNYFMSQIERLMPKTPTGFVAFAQEVYETYQKSHDEKVEGIRADLQGKLDKAEKRLKDIAEAIRDYLPKTPGS